MSLTALRTEATELEVLAEFDAVAENYEAALQQGLKASGESSEYFALGRIHWLKRRLASYRTSLGGIRKAIDFGCGTGNSIPHLRQILGAESVVGLDPSLQSLRIARRMHPDPAIQFDTPDSYSNNGETGLIFCNGVFHHIPLADRPEAVRRIRDWLAPGGIFAFWENNPWNPGTRYVMNRIPFDRDAITLSIPESRRLLENAGLRVLCVDTCFYFPRTMKWFRPVETYLCKIPLGAQYLVLAEKMP
jgi:SAM-dependent methyltransferase